MVPRLVSVIDLAYKWCPNIPYKAMEAIDYC